MTLWPDKPEIDVQDQSVCDTVDVLNLKKSPPFSASFAEVTEGVDISDNAGDAAANKNYSPASFECIHGIIHVYPSWS